MATDGFSDANLLGQGGFGYVHRGVLPNGKEVAIKQLKAGSGQGSVSFRQRLRLLVEYITNILFHWLGTVSLGLRGCLFMSLFQTIP